ATCSPRPTASVIRGPRRHPAGRRIRGGVNLRADPGGGGIGAGPGLAYGQMTDPVLDEPGQQFRRGKMATAGTRSRTAWGGPALAAVWSVVSARTWLAVIHLLVGLFLGTVAFTVVVTGAALGVALLVVALVGLPVLWAVLLLAGWFARAERA